MVVAPVTFAARVEYSCTRSSQSLGTSLISARMLLSTSPKKAIQMLPFRVTRDPWLPPKTSRPGLLRRHPIFQKSLCSAFFPLVGKRLEDRLQLGVGERTDNHPVVHDHCRR